MKHISFRAGALLLGILISTLPFFALAHEESAATGTPELSDIRGAAQVPLRASELASFVLSAVALVTAGISLSRTRKRHHSTHHVA